MLLFFFKVKKVNSNEICLTLNCMHILSNKIINNRNKIIINLITMLYKILIIFDLKLTVFF